MCGGIEYFTVYALLLVSGCLCLCLSLFIYQLLEVNYFGQEVSLLTVFLITWFVGFWLLFFTKHHYLLIYQYASWQDDQE